jgi:hypothetical protein
MSDSTAPNMTLGIAADKGVLTGIRGSTTNFERTLEVGSRALYACNCTSANRDVGFGAESDVEAFSHAYVSPLLSNNDCKCSLEVSIRR